MNKMTYFSQVAFFRYMICIFYSMTCSFWSMTCKFWSMTCCFWSLNCIFFGRWLAFFVRWLAVLGRWLPDFGRWLAFIWFMHFFLLIWGKQLVCRQYLQFPIMPDCKKTVLGALIPWLLSPLPSPINQFFIRFSPINICSQVAI